MLIIKINKLKNYHLQIFGAIARRNGIVVLRRQISIRHVANSHKTVLNTNYFQTYLLIFFIILEHLGIYQGFFKCEISTQTLYNKQAKIIPDNN